MTAIKTFQADRFLKTFDSRYRAILVHGPDAGAVAERARAAARRLATLSDPPGEILRIEEADLEQDPERLLVETQTIPMFGGPKVVHTRASRRVNITALKPLLEDGALAGSLVVEAGNLRSNDALRLLFEKAPHAAAVICYPDEARDIEAIIRDTLQAAGVAITPDARQALVSRLGADRAMTRGELEKLILYTRGKSQIDVDNVEAVVGDASELAIDKVVFAVASGAADRALAEYDRVITSGSGPQSVIAALQWHFQRLHRLRTAVEQGGSIEQALRQIRPSPPQKVQEALEAQCRIWTSDKLIAALSQIAENLKAARLSDALESPITERLILDLARMAANRPAARSRRA